MADYSEALVFRNEDGTATVEWTFRADTKQVLMSEELFLECVAKHNENVALRAALQSLYDATAWFSGSEGLIANARERAGVVLGGGNSQAGDA